MVLFKIRNYFFLEQRKCQQKKKKKERKSSKVTQIVVIKINNVPFISNTTQHHIAQHST